MKLTIDEALEILQKEIEWCLNNPYFQSDRDKQLGVSLTQDQQRGFMMGLRQAQILLERAEQVSQDSTD